MNEETVDGFDIPLRELTEEEATREVTFERFDEYLKEVGEDFCDQHGNTIDVKVLTGFLLAKRPEWNKELLEALNSKYTEPLSMLHVYEDMIAEDGFIPFYTDLAEFINLTGALKKRVNQILIQVTEYYQG